MSRLAPKPHALRPIRTKAAYRYEFAPRAPAFRLANWVQNFGTQTALFVMLALLLAGCQPQQPFYLKNVDDDQAYYRGVATEIEYPDLETEQLPDVTEALHPTSLQNREEQEIWNLSLEEAMRIALMNNRVMRNIGGQVQGPPDFIARNPELAPTIYDPAIAESNPRTGPEAALSAFDAQLSSSVTWNKIDTPNNVSPTYSFIYPNVTQGDAGVFQAKVSKVAATGAQFSLEHNAAYSMNNQPSRAWPSDWNVNLVAEVRQPLLQGAGVQFNRIAGPGATPGAFNGVMLARINTDIALADFESAVRNLVSDVEVAYWELYFQYRSLDAVIAGRDSALQTWRKIYTLYRHGAKGGEAEKEAQAREQYYLFRSTAEQSLNNLYATEAKLRYMMGLAATDGRLIRPKDEPTTAKVVFDWREVLHEGLARSVELREEKWLVKRRELELIAAKNFLLPKVDLVGQYSWLGLGNRIDGSNPWDPQQPGRAGRQRIRYVDPGPLSGISNGRAGQHADRLPPRDGRRAQRAVVTGPGKGASARGGTRTFAPVGLRRPRPGSQLRAQPNELQPSHSRPAAGRRRGRRLRNRHYHARRAVEGTAGAGPGGKRLLPQPGELQQVDRTGPLPQRLAVGIQRRLPVRGSVARQGVLRRSSSLAVQGRLDAARLRIHAAQGNQPRTGRAAHGIQRDGTERRGDGFLPKRSAGTGIGAHAGSAAERIDAGRFDTGRAAPGSAGAAKRGNGTMALGRRQPVVGDFLFLDGSGSGCSDQRMVGRKADYPQMIGTHGPIRGVP